MLKAGVPNARLLPKAVQKLDERTIRLVKVIVERMAGEAAQWRLAAQKWKEPQADCLWLLSMHSS